LLDHLDGRTRLHVLIGHPIAQVKSPPGVTRLLQQRGHNAVMVPVHVEPGDVDALLSALSTVRNLDGIIATVPHKFALYRHAATASSRAHVLGAANIARRNNDGSWHADMLDGLSMATAIVTAGGRIDGQRALLAGAGGAGGAIALSLLEAGVERLAIYDIDPGRRDALIARLQMRFGTRVEVGTADPSGCNLVVNATPAGMQPADPLPVMAERLTPDMFVADVITEPVVTPLLQAARRAGCGTQTGVGMYEAALDLMVDFLRGAASDLTAHDSGAR